MSTPIARKRRSARKPSLAKEFTPSREVTITPKRATDGGETWDVVVASCAIEKLADAAGVAQSDLGWLNDALKFMIFQLQCAKCDRAPTWPNQKKHLRTTLKAARKLEVLLRPQWLAAKMRLFEDLELRQQTFGIRGVIDLKTRADLQKFKEMDRRACHLLEGVMRDVEAVTRLRLRLSYMIDQFGPGPALPVASNLMKQFIADSALHWWTSLVLGEPQPQSKKLTAFADVLFRLAGFQMRSSAIAAQLTSAVKRRRAKSNKQRSER
jgi:hypothetical protein